MSKSPGQETFFRVRKSERLIRSDDRDLLYDLGYVT